MIRTLISIITFIITFCPAKASADACWISTSDNADKANTWLCFQKEFNVDKKPDSALARIACDSKYWLWLNGRQVVIEGAVKRGPNPTDTYYDDIDLSPYLKKGKNLVSVLVWYFGKQGFSYNPSGRAALFFDCSDGNFSLKSDNTWRGKMHPAYFTPDTIAPNFRLPESNIGFDARRDMPDWEKSYHAQWPAAVELGHEGDAPWGRLHHRVIPQWKDFGLKKYTSTEVRPGPYCDTLVATLPYNAQVMPYIALEAPEGKRITIKTDNHDFVEVNLLAQYVTRNGAQTYETKGWINGHKVFYILPHGVKAKKVMYRETGYDTEFEGYFKCDDDFANQLWDKAQRTLYITMRDTYMDCPDRERAQWWGDEVNESGEAFYALSTSSHKLMKKGMYELIAWQRPDSSIHAPVPASNYDSELPGQMLASVGQYGFWNYYLNTGDLKTISDLYDGVNRYISSWRKLPDGTVANREGGWQWGDWGENVDKQGLYNAWYYIALKGQRNIALALNRKNDADSIAAVMDSFKKAFNGKLWTGNGYRHPEYAEQTDDRLQALAVVGGLADSDKYPTLMKLFKGPRHASPYMEKYVLEALFMMGEGKYGIERMKERFSPMVYYPGYTTLFEGWEPKGFGGGTVNHAWSGGGLTILSQYVCGVSPIEPAFAEWAVKPCPAGINNAETLIPTVRGNIKVAYSDDDPLRFDMEVTIPATTAAHVGFPYPVQAVKIDGKKVWENGSALPLPQWISISDTTPDGPTLRVDKPGRHKIQAFRR